MKTLWILALGVVPLATLTVRGFLDASPVDGHATTFADSVDTQSAAALAEKRTAGMKSQKAVAAALIDVDAFSPAALADLEALPPESPLGSLRRTWPAWTAARSIVEEFLSLPNADGQAGLDRLKAARQPWQEFQRKLDAAKLPGASSLATLVDQRLSAFEQQVARLETRAEAAEAAGLVASAFGAGQYDQCLTRSQQWLAKYSGTAEAALVEQIKAMGFRAEFHLERERSRTRIKAAASPAEREAVLVTFLDRFSKPGPLDGSERTVLEQCRAHLDGLRAEAATRERSRAEEEAIRLGLSELPARFDERVARAARIVEKYPSETVRAALRTRVAGWLEESLPEEQYHDDAEFREAQTKDGRILRGFFREVTGPDGAVGYKRYDTLAQRHSPTADVGTWRSEDLVSLPSPPLAQRLVERYRAGRARLLDRPDRSDLWEGFAAFCERLQSQWDEYRAKPGAGEEVIGFRAEAAFARQVLSGSTLRDLQVVWGESKEP
jgi:hypothetical protein